MSEAARQPPGRTRSQAQHALRSLGRALKPGLAERGRAVAGGARAVWARVEPVARPISAAGWIVIAAAAGSLALWLGFGWIEFAFLSFTLFAAVVVAVPFVFGRMAFDVDVSLTPRRVVAGDRAFGRIAVRNTAEKASSPARVELPVGAGLAEFHIPQLAGGAEHEELFAVPTERRAVIVAGPAISVRGDQLGLLRRTVRWTDPVELFVHPRTARLTPSAAGLVRDLEGEVTKVITDSDISFHALRNYEPGDPLRNVHWRTSARTGTLMVRQFEETRRSELALIQSTEQSRYASEEEFELGVSVLASVALQVIRDATELSVITEGLQLRTATPVTLLDDSCRIEPANGAYPSMREYVREATKRLKAPSVAIVVVGSAQPLADIRAVDAHFGPATQTIALRVETGAASRIQRVGDAVVATVGELAELPRIMRRIRP
ncbi:DUF58 domain-containing protein [Agromyces archimandritae]|uniref:DUF58 domain-containing protein n=1 Tax=Agromyces archimandritae TaxID=2781962 RepID=A0A975FMI1_9MICO|nr:DUF58 domain-containing protein [Agromyces archimandritae]QTX04442.1 DUF58 domain-containing protein [Agromyces archimandritae]